MAKSTFEKDLYRYYGDRKESLRQKMFRPAEIKYIYWMRKAREAGKIGRIIARLKLRGLSGKTGLQIPWNASIGEGFYIGHCGAIVVNPAAKIGKNVNVAIGVTIGQENRGKRKGTPTIGDNCWIGTNAVVVGNITVGEDVLIAPLTYVNFDVPPHSIVIGNPGRIIPRDNAVEGYVNNKV
jgi:serine O-acetyltransferase